MANVTIDGLPSATTPLAGTEELPIWQGGVTKKTTVSAWAISPANSLTANGNQTQSGTLTLTASAYNVITTSTSSNNSGTLPAATAGATATTVFNQAANAVFIFPASGGQINALGANASFMVLPGAATAFCPVTSTQWYTK